MSFVNLSLIGKLLFRLLMVGIYLVINGVSTKLCLKSVKWNICLKGFRIIQFVSLLVGNFSSFGLFKRSGFVQAFSIGADTLLVVLWYMFFIFE